MDGNFVYHKYIHSKDFGVFSELYQDMRIGREVYIFGKSVGYKMHIVNSLKQFDVDFELVGSRIVFKEFGGKIIFV